MTCKRHIEMTPLCNIEVTLPKALRATGAGILKTAKVLGVGVSVVQRLGSARTDVASLNLVRGLSTSELKALVGR